MLLGFALVAHVNAQESIFEQNAQQTQNTPNNNGNGANVSYLMNPERVENAENTKSTINANAGNNFNSGMSGMYETGITEETPMFGSPTDPLYPYSATNYYLKNLDHDAAIIQLFQQHYSAPPVHKLHNRWILKKYNEGNYSAVTDNYFQTGNEKAECAYRASQLALGNRQAALENIDWLWLSPKSVSSLCDPVFNIWDKSFNPEFIVKRAKKAYYKGNAALVSQLAERLPYDNPNRMVLTRFASYLSSPTSLLSEYPAGLTDSALARDLLPTALDKLVRIDSSNYASFAAQFSQQLGDNPRYQKMLGKLVGYLANRTDAQAQSIYALMTHPDDKATESALRYLIAMRDWAGIRQIVNPNSNNAMGLYWLGRALEATGQDPRSAYTRAARDRSYYGFLAADKAGLPYQFNEDLISPNSSLQSSFSDNMSLVRAKLLANRGENKKAKREILPLSKVMKLAQKRQLAYWLSRHGFNYEAIYILGKARDWNDINVRFPTPYNSQVALASRTTGVDPTWIYAIIRQESSMNPNAVSRSKAKGLMQLIPSTASMVARQQGIPLYGDDIFNPGTNTQLGAAYLADMFERFGNVAMASAAYNAGPGRVDEWSTGLDDMAIWVEKIPYDETRKYVKNILEYQQVYAHHLGKKIPSITDRLEGRYQAISFGRGE